MHLAFVDITYDYTADRPEQPQSLGGTTAATCFLARELVKQGVACTFFNKVREPCAAHGITSLPLEALTEERRNPAYSAFIFCGRWTEWLVALVREGMRVPLVAWMHENLFGTHLVPAVPAFDAVAFVSAWQAGINQPHILPHWRTAILRNAMNPAFENMFPADESILAAKATPPMMAYVGSTPRGVLHLPVILPHLERRFPDAKIEIFCNPAPSTDPVRNEAFTEALRALPNVAHVGAVGQSELAQRLKRVAVLVAPNPWPETSCIALIEAMAAGLSCVTTNRAALPETAGGLARHVAIENADHPSDFTMSIDAVAFAAAVGTALGAWRTQPEMTERHLRAQIEEVNTRYRWSARAGEWISFIARLAR